MLWRPSFPKSSPTGPYDIVNQLDKLLCRQERSKECAHHRGWGKRRGRLHGTRIGRPCLSGGAHDSPDAIGPCIACHRIRSYPEVEEWWQVSN